MSDTAPENVAAPIPVEIINPNPVPVVVAPESEQAIQHSQPPAKTALPPQTTAEENLKSKGQRNINLIWEVTQAVVALDIVGIFTYSVVKNQPLGEFGAGIVGLVIGFYFSRTNHARIGDTPRSQANALDTR